MSSLCLNCCIRAELSIRALLWNISVFSQCTYLVPRWIFRWLGDRCVHSRMCVPERKALFIVIILSVFHIETGWGTEREKSKQFIHCEITVECCIFNICLSFDERILLKMEQHCSCISFVAPCCMYNITDIIEKSKFFLKEVIGVLQMFLLQRAQETGRRYFDTTWSLKRRNAS